MKIALNVACVLNIGPGLFHPLTLFMVGACQKDDVKSSFIHTGKAQSDFYVVTAHESCDRGHYLLSMTAGYGLVNAIANWKDLSDGLLQQVVIPQLPVIPQIFHILQKGGPVFLVANMFGHFRVTVLPNIVDKFQN